MKVKITVIAEIQIDLAQFDDHNPITVMEGSPISTIGLLVDQAQSARPLIIKVEEVAP